jgi:hypothetical protein
MLEVKQLKFKNDLFELIVLELLVHGCLVPHLWVYGETQHPGGEGIVE